MKREKALICVSVTELLSVIEKEASQMEELAKSIEGTYTRHIEYCDSEENSNLISVVTYIGLEYTEKQGIRAILKFQHTYTRDTDGKVSKSTVTTKYSMKDLQWIVGRYKGETEYKKI